MVKKQRKIVDRASPSFMNVREHSVGVRDPGSLIVHYSIFKIPLSFLLYTSERNSTIVLGHINICLSLCKLVSFGFFFNLNTIFHIFPFLVLFLYFCIACPLSFTDIGHRASKLLGSIYI
jgi:hypothetical protein